MPGPYLNTGAFKTRVTSNDSTQQEELGVWRFEDGNIYRYVRANALIPRGEPVVLDTTVTTAALMGHYVLQLSSATAMIMGIAEATLASGNFGWITAYGPATARVVTNTIPNVALTGSTTTGVLATWSSTAGLFERAIALQTGLSAGSAVFITAL